MHAALLLSLLVPGPADSLRIAEIHYAPSDPALEFVEVVNIGSSSVPASGLTLSDSRDAPSAVSDPAGPVLPGGRLVLVRDATAFSSRWPGIPHHQVAPWPTLNNDGDDAVIRFDGREVDRVSYDPDWGRPGASLERRDPAGPSSHRVNWGASLDPSGATPGRPNTLHAPDRTPPRLRMADRTAPGTISILFDEPVDLSDAVFEVDGVGHSAASSSADLAEASVAIDPSWPDGTLRAREVRDLFGNTMEAVQATVAHLPGPGTLRITEVLTKPDARVPGRFAFVEIISASNRLQSLRGLRLQGPPDPYGLRSEAAVPLPGTGLEYGTRVVLYDAARRADADSLFRRTWPSAARALLVPIPAWPLGSDPREIRLVDREGIEVNEARVSLTWHDPVPGPSPDRSLERVDPLDSLGGPSRWTSSPDPCGATPGETNRAETLARGRPPAAGELRITEVLFEADAGQPEFVELASRARDAIDPNGVYLVYAPADAAPDSVRIGYAPDALANGDLMVLVWPLGTGGSPFVADDLSHAFPSSAGRIPETRIRPAEDARSLRNGGASLVLRAPDGTEIDRVDYGAALHHPAIGETRGVAVERIDWDGSSNEPTNWTSSTHPERATPGYRTTVAPGPSVPGRGVSVEPRVFTPDADVGARHVAVHVHLHDGPSVTDVQVFDLAGRPVRTLADGRLSTGRDVVYWNGLDDRGLPAATGPYVVLVRSWAMDGAVRGDRLVVVLARR